MTVSRTPSAPLARPALFAIGLVALGAAAGSASAQFTFQHAIGTQRDERAYGVELTRDGGFISVGYRRNGDQGRDMLVVKHDNKGRPVWERLIIGPGDDVAYAVRQTADGGYAVAGETTSTAGVGIVKLDPVGNLVWARGYPGAPFMNDTLSLALIECSNRDIAVATRINNVAGVQASDCELIRINANGVPLFAKRYSDARYSNLRLSGFTDLREWFDTANNAAGFVMSGYTARTAQSPREATVTRVNPAGAPLQARNLQVQNIDLVGYGIDNLRGNEFAMELRVNNTFNGPPGSGITRFNIGLLPIWTRTFATFFGGHASIQQDRTAVGNICVAGWTQPAAGGPLEASMILVNLAGAPVLEMTYGGATVGIAADDAFESLWPTPEPGFVAAGWTNSFGVGPSEFYLVKVDSSGRSGCLERPIQYPLGELPNYTDFQYIVPDITGTIWQPQVPNTQVIDTILCIPCPADFNGDGFVDFFDMDAFVDCYSGGPCPPGKTADFNGDGFVDFFDMDAFTAAFEEGC